MTKTLQTKCKTCFVGPRMILHALPGLAKDHTKYGCFFFGILPLAKMTNSLDTNVIVESCFDN